MQNSKTVCKKCGKTEDEHCKFDPVVIPKGCVCNPNNWFVSGKIPSVCSHHEEDSSVCLCKNCEHLKECHGQVEEGE